MTLTGGLVSRGKGDDVLAIVAREQLVGDLNNARDLAQELSGRHLKPQLLPVAKIHDRANAALADFQIVKPLGRDRNFTQIQQSNALTLYRRHCQREAAGVNPLKGLKFCRFGDTLAPPRASHPAKPESGPTIAGGGADRAGLFLTITFCNARKFNKNQVWEGSGHFPASSRPAVETKAPMRGEPALTPFPSPDALERAGITGGEFGHGRTFSQHGSPAR